MIDGPTGVTGTTRYMTKRHVMGSQENVKTASTWIFLGVMAVGLIYDLGHAQAQSESAPIVTGSEDKPWNKGVPAETREAARAVFLEGNRLFS